MTLALFAEAKLKEPFMTIKRLHPFKSQSLQVLAFTAHGVQTRSAGDFLDLAMQIGTPDPGSVVSISAHGAPVTPPHSDERRSEGYSLWTRRADRWQMVSRRAQTFGDISIALMQVISDGAVDEVRLCSPGTSMPPSVDPAHEPCKPRARRPLVTYLADLLRKRHGATVA